MLGRPAARQEVFKASLIGDNVATLAPGDRRAPPTRGCGPCPGVSHDAKMLSRAPGGAVAACLSESFAPRAWFRAVHGPDNAASRLAAFLDQVAARDGQGSGAGGIARLTLRARGEPAPPAQV